MFYKKIIISGLLLLPPSTRPPAEFEKSPKGDANGSILKGWAVHWKPEIFSPPLGLATVKVMASVGFASPAIKVTK